MKRFGPVLLAAAFRFFAGRVSLAKQPKPEPARPKLAPADSVVLFDHTGPGPLPTETRFPVVRHFGPRQLPDGKGPIPGGIVLHLFDGDKLHAAIVCGQPNK